MINNYIKNKDKIKLHYLLKQFLFKSSIINMLI